MPLTKPPSWFVRNRLWIAGAAALCLVGLGAWQAAAHGLINGGSPLAHVSPPASVAPTVLPSQTPQPSATPSPSATPTPTATPTPVSTPTPPISTPPPVSLFSTSAPAQECRPGCPDYRPWELGLKFSSDVNGYVTAIRFYKGSLNTVAHQGNLWTSTGQLLATVAFSKESVSGWQQANLPSPVRISAGQTYVVSFNTSGDFFYSENFTGASNPPLHGAGGMFGQTPGAFPSQPITRNYWADVVFSR